MYDYAKEYERNMAKIRKQYGLPEPSKKKPTQTPMQQQRQLGNSADIVKATIWNPPPQERPKEDSFESMKIAKLEETARTLAKQVQELSDQLAMMKRGYEDILYNLDDQNMSPELIKEKGNMKSSIKLNAEGIELLSQNMTEQGAELTGKIEVVAGDVNILASEVFPNGVTNESSIDVNARGITSLSYALTAQGNSFQSQIDQQAASIEMRVTANYFNPVTVNYPPPYNDKARMYYHKVANGVGTYYFWNGYDWVAADGTNPYSVFLQTADGFYLKGNVQITGDMITSGTIRGLTIEGGTIRGGRYYNINGEAYLEVGDDIYGDFKFVNTYGDNVFEIEDYRGDTAIRSNGTEYLSLGGGIAICQEEWNFYNAEVTGLFARDIELNSGTSVQTKFEEVIQWLSDLQNQVNELANPTPPAP